MDYKPTANIQSGNFLSEKAAQKINDAINTQIISSLFQLPKEKQETALVKVKSIISIGKYWAEIINSEPPEENTIATANTDDLDLTAATTSDLVILYNLAEIDTTVNNLGVASITTGVLIGFTPVDGVPILATYSGGGTLPTGQYVGMLLQVTSNDEIGFDWARSHAVI